jgi:hypothetical protein
MLAYYLENLRNYKNKKIFLILDKTYDRTIFNRYDIKFILKVLKIIDPKLIEHLSIKVPQTFNFNFKNLFFFLRNFNQIQKTNLNFINNLSKKIKIDYHEIWTGNSEIINFFPSTKKILKFEHGLSELGKYSKYKKDNLKFLGEIKRKIENLISKKFFYKNNYFFEFTLISIFKSLININFKNIIYIKNYFKTIKYYNSIHKIKYKKIKKNILINYPFTNFSNTNLIKKFNYEFSNFIKMKLAENKIDDNFNIIIKRKSSHSKKNIFNFIHIMKNCGFKNKIINFEKIYKTNLLIDLFIEKINPKILFTNLNSSVVVFNTAYPKKKIILTDQFIIDFIQKNKNFFVISKNELSIFNDYKNNIGYLI